MRPRVAAALLAALAWTALSLQLFLTLEIKQDHIDETPFARWQGVADGGRAAQQFKRWMCGLYQPLEAPRHDLGRYDKDPDGLNANTLHGRPHWLRQERMIVRGYREGCWAFNFFCILWNIVTAEQKRDARRQLIFSCDG